MVCEVPNINISILARMLLSLSHSGVTAEGSYDHNYQTVRVGVNYHFLPSYEPLK